MLNLIYLFILLSTLLTITHAQDYSTRKPSNIQLTPSDLSPTNSMTTQSHEWRDSMTQAFTTVTLGQYDKWHSFDTTFSSPQFYTINLYKWGEGGYQSPGDCFKACQEFMYDAINAGLQEFQCDHWPGGRTHCWFGYGPRIHQDKKRSLLA